MASAEGRLVPRGMGYGEGCPFRSRLGDLGERRQVSQRFSGQSPGPLAENGFWRILKATGRSFCTYMTKSEGDNLH